MAQSTAMPPAAEEPASPSGRGERFVTNVLWGWLAMCAAAATSPPAK